jgi:hypothetical protein
MKRYSSSTLKMFNRNCPAALGFYENQTPCDKSIFQAGIAAHAVLQVCGEKSAYEIEDCREVAEAVVKELITKGRSYKGIPEPPMSPEDAMLGRDIALEYLAEYPLLMPQGAEFESAFGIDKNGKWVDIDSENIRYDAIFDVMYTDIEGDEEFNTEVVVVRDYKSAWPTCADELDTLQVKGHAVIAAAHFACTNPSPSQLQIYSGVRNEIVNLRTKQIYTRTTLFNEEGLATLEQWRKDILTACSAADTTREARPGAGCIDCMYTLACGDCIAAYADDDVPVRFATAKALVGKLGKVVRSDAKIQPIPVPGGEIAYRGTNEKIPTVEAIDTLIEYWFMDKADDEPVTLEEIRGMLLSLDVKASSYEKAAKVLFPEKADASYIDMIDACITIKVKSRFDVYKT